MQCTPRLGLSTQQQHLASRGWFSSLLLLGALQLGLVLIQTRESVLQMVPQHRSADGPRRKDETREAHIRARFNLLRRWAHQYCLEVGAATLEREQLANDLVKPREVPSLSDDGQEKHHYVDALQIITGANTLQDLWACTQPPQHRTCAVVQNAVGQWIEDDSHLSVAWYSKRRERHDLLLGGKLGVGEGHPHAKDASLSDVTLHLHHAAHQLCELLANGKAKAGASISAGLGGINLREALKQQLDVFSRDANARVVH
mmetsp:Transcript_10609/g.24667  ORF Transcript_10609/g.24667 Transcript_10609/m.24667 type:complete len:258 (-) Transcript_10609:289-1062(-)